MLFNKNYYVYFLTNWNNKVMYIGVTNNLERRIQEHKSKQIEGFTKKYNVTKLVYYDVTNDINIAIEHEKKYKGWTRAKKNELVESVNSEWKDLAADWY